MPPHPTGPSRSEAPNGTVTTGRPTGSREVPEGGLGRGGTWMAFDKKNQCLCFSYDFICIYIYRIIIVYICIHITQSPRRCPLVCLQSMSKSLRLKNWSLSLPVLTVVLQRQQRPVVPQGYVFVSKVHD